MFLLAEGKHSLVFDCRNGWVFKSAVSADQNRVVNALMRIIPFLPQEVCVAESHPVIGGYFQRRITGHHPSVEYSMKIAYQINQNAFRNHLYFTDIVPNNIIVSYNTSYLIDICCTNL